MHVAVLLVLRLFQTRSACVVWCPEGRLCGVDLELRLGCVLGEVRCKKKVEVEVMLLVSGTVDTGDSRAAWAGGCGERSTCWRVCGS